MKQKTLIVILITVLAFVLAACSSGSKDTSAPEDASASGDSSPVNDAEVSSDSQGEDANSAKPDPTSVPAVTPEKAAADEPAIEPTESTDEVSESAGDPAEDFTKFDAEAFDIQLAYPEGWQVTEDPDLGLIIESSEGILELLTTKEGAAIVILPRDELADEEIVEALRQSVFSFGPAPDVFIEYPTVSVNGDHDVATAAFRERESGIEGYYVFIQNEGQGVFVFAASTGLAKAYFLGLLEATIDTVELGDGSTTS
ncbi:MAG TPA: hypothetical protein VFI27_18590 [candidate division Zixibacteria bacterium]|nr:hypothetical protein [candidate division Zixibacteria bacterium]